MPALNYFLPLILAPNLFNDLTIDTWSSIVLSNPVITHHSVCSMSYPRKEAPHSQCLCGMVLDTNWKACASVKKKVRGEVGLQFTFTARDACR